MLGLFKQSGYQTRMPKGLERLQASFIIAFVVVQAFSVRAEQIIGMPLHFTGSLYRLAYEVAVPPISCDCDVSKSAALVQQQDNAAAGNPSR